MTPPVVILCGGQGTRLREETEFRPKPLVPIGGRPILWHIMRRYAMFGYGDFLLALGYKGEMIKDYFVNYDLRNHDICVDLGTRSVSFLEAHHDDPWRVTMVDTGDYSMTGGRLKRLQRHLEGNDEFFMTYGDGVADVDLDALLAFHRASGCAVTVTGVRPIARFGELHIDGERVVRFAEKPQTDDDLINGGFFVMTPAIFDYIDDDAAILEKSPLERLAVEGRLAVYRHDGFWRCMDTVRDMEALNEECSSGPPRWLQ